MQDDGSADGGGQKPAQDVPLTVEEASELDRC